MPKTTSVSLSSSCFHCCTPGLLCAKLAVFDEHAKNMYTGRSRIAWNLRTTATAIDAKFHLEHPIGREELKWNQTPFQELVFSKLPDTINHAGAHLITGVYTHCPSINPSLAVQCQWIWSKQLLMGALATALIKARATLRLCGQDCPCEFYVKLRQYIPSTRKALLWKITQDWFETSVKNKFLQKVQTMVACYSLAAASKVSFTKEQLLICS